MMSMTLSMMALGSQAATAQFVCAPGASASATGPASLACGPNATANGDFAVAVGDGAHAQGIDATALGSTAEAYTASTSIGGGAGWGQNATNMRTTFVGSSAGIRSSGNENTAVGVGAGRDVAGGGNIAIGYETGIYVRGTGNVSIGNGAGSFSDRNFSVAVGTESNTGAEGVAVGAFSDAADAAVAVGAGATAGFTAIAVGTQAEAAFSDSAAIGSFAVATRAGQQVFGNSTNTYTMAGINSAASRTAQGAPTALVTTNAAGDLASHTASELGLATTSHVSGLQAQIDHMGQSDEELRDGIAISMALAQPMLLPGQTFAVRAGWGNFDNANAVGVVAAGVLTHNSIFGGSVVVDGGVGYGSQEGTVAGRGGLTLGW